MLKEPNNLHLSLDKVLPNGFKFRRRCSKNDYVAAGVFLRRAGHVGCTMCGGTFGHPPVRINSQPELSRCKKCMLNAFM